MGVQDKGDTIKNFFTTLAENNRLGVLSSVCDKFAILMSAHKGEVELNITSAAVSSPMEETPIGQMLTNYSPSTRRSFARSRPPSQSQSTSGREAGSRLCQRWIRRSVAG